MVGETVLVVDDTPLSLKLVATILRGEGFQVHLASTAEQALTTLRTMVPRLLLVDLQLPGMNGLELTRHVRQDPRTSAMLIVALTASARSDAEQLAYDAGCDGFIAKPIDTRSLGARLRSYLNAQVGAGPEPDTGAPGMPTALWLSGPEMDGLRRTFLADGSRQVRRMLEFVNSRLDVGQAARLFHQWVGSAGALGYMELSERAREAGTLLGMPGWTKSDLRDALIALAEAFASPREAADTPIPDSLVRELAHQRVALIGFADEEADRLCVAFDRVHARPQLFGGNEPADSEAIRTASAIMVHVRAATLDSPWLESGFRSPCPLVLVGGREDLLGLPLDVQAGACEFLIDGWQPEEAIMRLSLALARGTHAPPVPGETPQRGPAGQPGVVIADDDTQVLAVVRWALQSLGMECHSATDGPEALNLVCELRPQAAVLDVSMPGMNGFEVLAAIRHAAMPVRVIMLTASQRQRDVLRGFELGADDYVVKPFHPMELAARLKRFL